MALRIRLYDGDETLGIMDYPDHTFAESDQLNKLAGAVHQQYVSRLERQSNGSQEHESKPISPFIGCVVEFVPEETPDS